MKRGEAGRYQVTDFGGEEVRAFIPAPLPPDPPIALEGALQQLLEEALLALGRLDSVTQLLPNPLLFIYNYVRKEAVLSSQIEGRSPRSLTCCCLNMARLTERPPKTLWRCRTTYLPSTMGLSGCAAASRFRTG